MTGSWAHHTLGISYYNKELLLHGPHDDYSLGIHILHRGQNQIRHQVLDAHLVQNLRLSLAFLFFSFLVNNFFNFFNYFFKCLPCVCRSIFNKKRLTTITCDNYFWINWDFPKKWYLKIHRGF